MLTVLIVLTVEFVAGMIFNQQFKYWDYRHEFVNLYGQICLKFAAIWYPVGIFAIVLDDALRWKLLKEEKPQYKLLS